MVNLDSIYNMDCIEGLKLIEDTSINLVITSPPYNVDLGNNKFNKSAYDLYNDNKEHKEYIKWLKEIFAITYDKLVDGGRVCINVGDGKNGSIPTSSDIIQFMTNELNYIPMTHIIWNKNQTSNRAAWGSFCSPSCPSFPTPFEHILVFCKGDRKLQHKGNSDLTKDEFIKWSNPLWTFPPEIKMKSFGHPAMFPEELPYRLIKLFSYKGDIVLDMFSGCGTTCKVAQQLNRHFLGFELSTEYYEKSIERLHKSRTVKLF